MSKETRGEAKSALQKAAQVVAALMGIFGGFLLNLSPPAHYLAPQPLLVRRVNHGIASFCVFLLFLFIMASLSKCKAVDTARWLTRGVRFSIVGVVAIMLYAWGFGELIVGSGDYVYLAGLWKSPSWVEHNTELVARYGGSNKELFDAMPRRHYVQAWPMFSRLVAYVLVQTFYIVSIVSLFAGVFCFWEGVLNVSISTDQRGGSRASTDQETRRSPPQLAPQEKNARQEPHGAEMADPPRDNGDSACLDVGEHNG